MSTTKITERNLDEEFLQTLYTKDNPPTASDVGAVAESDLATAIQSLIDSGVIEVGEKAYTPSDTLVKTVLSSAYSGSVSSGKSMLLGKWIPERSGSVLIKGNIKAPDATMCLGALTDSDRALSTTLMDEYKNLLKSFNNSSVGSITTHSSIDVEESFPSATSSNTSYSEVEFILRVEKGVPVYFYLCSTFSSSYTGYCNSIKVYADEV